jgi:hypothetical protein
LSKRFILIILAFVFAGGAARAENDPPPHWNLLIETLRQMRGVMESSDAGFPRDPQKISTIRQSVELLTREENAKRLVDYLVGTGMTQPEFGRLMVDYEALNMRNRAGLDKELLGDLFFETFRDGLGLSDKPTPQRKYFLEAVDKEVAQAAQILRPTGPMQVAEDRLAIGTTRMQRIAYGAMILGGLAIGETVYQAAPHLGFGDIPIEHTIAPIAAAVAAMRTGFKYFWPMTQAWFSKRFLRGRYHDLVAAGKETLEMDRKTGLPRVAEKARPTGPAVLSEEDAALDALFADKHPDTTEALFDVAIDSYSKGFPERADKIFREIAQREQQSDLGRLAGKARDSIKAHKELDKGVFRLKRNYLAGWIGGTTAGLAVIIYAIAAKRPDLMPLSQALMFHGIGIAGAAEFFTHIWSGPSEESIRRRTMTERDAFAQSLIALLNEGKTADGGSRRSFDSKKFAVDMVEALAKHKGTGSLPESLRTIARGVLHQFNEDAAMSFLILKAQDRIYTEAVERRESPEKKGLVLNDSYERKKACLQKLRDLK